jgi:hypothetical protein
LQKRFPEIAPKLGRWLGMLSIVIFIITALVTGKVQDTGDQGPGR